MARAKRSAAGRAPGWAVQRPVTRKMGARPVRPIGYRLVTLPQTPQEEIDVCLECPLPECMARGCPLEARKKK